jgi:hypothetical protein
MRPDDSEANPDHRGLRKQAIVRVVNLLQQLEADRSDLRQFTQRSDSVELQPGAAPMARAIAAAKRVRERLQGG